MFRHWWPIPDSFWKISDGPIRDRDQLNNEVPTMVTSPTGSGLKNEIIDFNISGDIRSHQSINSAQDDETM